MEKAVGQSVEKSAIEGVEETREVILKGIERLRKCYVTEGKAPNGVMSDSTTSRNLANEIADEILEEIGENCLPLPLYEDDTPVNCGDEAQAGIYQGKIRDIVYRDGECERVVIMTDDGTMADYYLDSGDGKVQRPQKPDTHDTQEKVNEDAADIAARMTSGELGTTQDALELVLSLLERQRKLDEEKADIQP